MDRWQKVFNGLLIAAAVLVAVVWVIGFISGSEGTVRNGIDLVLLAGLPIAAFFVTPGSNSIRLVSVAVVFVGIDAVSVYLLSLREHMYLAEYWPWALAYVVGAGFYWWLVSPKRSNLG